jgi:NAD(P)-dependent dehydrogenase (short-subunit alcohol dehydrogenase family)
MRNGTTIETDNNECGGARVGLIDGKVAIVTGAGHGIGRGHALALSKAGAKVVVNDLGGSVSGDGTDKGVAEEVVQVIRSRGGEAVANSGDVSDWKDAEDLVHQAVSAFGQLDILINNAGIVRDKMLFNMTEQDWDAVIGVHLKGTFATTHHACVWWRERYRATGDPVNASIVNTTSPSGLYANPGQANYGSAKAGVVTLTRVTSVEMGRYGIRANAISPAASTRITATMRTGSEGPREPDDYTTFESANPGNCGPVVVWLGSNASDHVTGQVFGVSGTTITHYIPWSRGESVTNPRTDEMWEPEQIGPAVDSLIFHSRDLEMRHRRLD